MDIQLLPVLMFMAFCLYAIALYVHDPCFNGIPDTLEIEWVYEEQNQ